MTNTLDEFYQKFASEEDCIKFLLEMRWGKNITCPRCGFNKVYQFKSGKLLKCGGCRKQFTVKIGTIFEESRIPLKTWFQAIYLLTSMKKGVSSIQMAKFLGVTQKTAWFLLQRIRYAVGHESFNKPLEGIVENDETYVGGVGRHNKRGRGAENKTAVLGMIERQGMVKSVPVGNVKSKTIVPIIRENVKIGTVMMTDEFLSYRRLPSEGYIHLKVNHGIREYAREGGIHTNTIEGYWSHLKRGLEAIYTHVSPKHLGKYLDEYSFRYNTRILDDFQRFSLWFSTCSGKRLTYEGLIG